MADELNALARDLSAVPADSWPRIAKALGVTAGHVKDDWAENLGGTQNQGSAFRHVGRAIDYDVVVSGASLARAALAGSGGTGLEAEIGPNLGRAQGSFGGWFEEGQSNIPALHAGHAAMKANEADFERGLDRAVDDALKARGL